MLNFFSFFWSKSIGVINLTSLLLVLLFLGKFGELFSSSEFFCLLFISFIFFLFLRDNSNLDTPLFCLLTDIFGVICLLLDEVSLLVLFILLSIFNFSIFFDFLNSDISELSLSSLWYFKFSGISCLLYSYFPFSLTMNIFFSFSCKIEFVLVLKLLFFLVVVFAAIYMSLLFLAVSFSFFLSLSVKIFFELFLLSSESFDIFLLSFFC